MSCGAESHDYHFHVVVGVMNGLWLRFPALRHDLFMLTFFLLTVAVVVCSSQGLVLAMGICVQTLLDTEHQAIN